jgi:hypothetical protein
VIDVECPACKKKIQGPDTSAGKTIRCPACRSSLKVPVSGSAAMPAAETEAAAAGRPESGSRKPSTNLGPRASRPSPGARRETSGQIESAVPPAARKGLFASPILRWGVLIGGVLVVLVGVIFVIGLSLEGDSKSLLEYARKRITADVADPEERRIALVLARTLHLRAINEATPRDLRGRRGLRMPAASPYYETLQSLISESLKGLNSTGRLDPTFLSDFWESRESEKEAVYVVHLKKDGTYRDAVYNIHDSEYEHPQDGGSGTWDLKERVLTWHNAKEKDDPNPVVRWGNNAFILKEADGSYSYFHRIGLRKKIRDDLQ